MQNAPFKTNCEYYRILNSRLNILEFGPRMGRKSNSKEETSNEELREEVPDYLDKAGRRWHFLCHAKEGEEDLAQFCQENGLVPGNENGKRRKFGCSRPECHFRAVFLKANSGIYTRGEHCHNYRKYNMRNKIRDILKKSNERVICSHSVFSKIICRDNEEIFISHGKEFKLVRRFKTKEEFDKYRRQNWLMNAGGTQKCYNDDRIYLRCRRYSNHNKIATNCRVYGIYIKRNHSLYQNNEQHNHPMGEEHNDNFSRFLSKYVNDNKTDYVDRFGKYWQFLRKIDILEELKKYAKEQMLYHYGNNTRRLFIFKCKYAYKLTLKRHPYPPPYCQMRAIFIRATSSIYVQNEHSHHPAFELRSHKKANNDWIHMATLNNGKNDEKNLENNNASENVPTPKEEPEEEDGTDHDEEVRIVKHLQRDYKCLGRMKREGGEQDEEQSSTRTDCPVHRIQLGEEEEQGTSQRKTSSFYRYMQRELRQHTKKEEPEEAEPEAELPVPQLQVPPNVPWLQQFAVARPARMLLRERKKRINYGK